MNKAILAIAVILLAWSAPGRAAIDSLWSSPATTGYKCALSDCGTGRVTYLAVVDSTLNACRVYDADNFSQVYTTPFYFSAYTYIWPQFIDDASGNGHPEMLVYEYNQGTNRYETRIVDMSSGVFVKDWSSGTYSYLPKFLGTTPGSNVVKLGIERSSGTAGSYPSRLLVYSLGVTGVAAAPGSAPRNGISLEQSYPNPAADLALVEFELARAGRAKVAVYNQLGQEVRVLADREFSPGRHAISFDGRGLPNGAYFYRLSTADGGEVKRLLLVK
jgi:hypothetical protein